MSSCLLKASLSSNSARVGFGFLERKLTRLTMTLRGCEESDFAEFTAGNILADTPISNPDKILVVGAHLASVPERAGINDYGSGSALLLEIALQMSNLGMLDSEDTGVSNRVRFAWWGAEKSGLLGSEHYVYSLPESILITAVRV